MAPGVRDDVPLVTRRTPSTRRRLQDGVEAAGDRALEQVRQARASAARRGSGWRCGLRKSASSTMTDRPDSAMAAARLTTVLVLPSAGAGEVTSRTCGGRQVARSSGRRLRAGLGDGPARDEQHRGTQAAVGLGRAAAGCGDA